MKRTYKIILVLVLTVTFLSCKKEKKKDNSNAASVEASITVSGNDNKQVIQGFGCATVFTPPNTSALTSEEFDRLFGSANGQVGLNILRIRIASDDAWRAIELNYAKAAKQRGAIILASPWSPPARMKTNNSIISGKLIPDSAAAYAKYLNDFAVYMANNGAALHAVSVQNEPDWDTNYESCVWTGTEMRDFLKNHGAAITAAKLMAPELVNNNQTYINTILADDGATANLDIFGTHIYGGGIIDNPQIRSKGKEIWMTEHLDTLSTYASGISTAVEIHNCLTKANFNAYIWWYGKRFYGPIGQDGIVTRRGYIISHFARFIKPGAVRLGMSANSRSDVLLSAYKNGSKKVLVAINVGAYNVKQKISFDAATASSFVPYVTTATKNVEQGAAVTSTGNSFEFVLPPNSVATFVEQ